MTKAIGPSCRVGLDADGGDDGDYAVRYDDDDGAHVFMMRMAYTMFTTLMMQFIFMRIMMVMLIW